MFRRSKFLVVSGFVLASSLTSAGSAEPVRLTMEGTCPALTLADEADRALRAQGFEPAADADVELEIHQLCGGGYVILIRDHVADSVLREQLGKQPVADVVARATTLLAAVVAESAPPSADATTCEVPTAIDVAPPVDASLAAWESQRSSACVDKCRDKGQCSWVDSSCIATSDAHCRASIGCRNEGRCREVAGQCLATQDRDCRRSRACRNHGRCIASDDEHRCVDDRERRSRGLLGVSITGVSIAGVAFVAGIAHLAVTSRDWQNPESETTALPGALLMGAGAVGIPLSIVGIVYGAERVPRGDALPTVSLSPTNGSLTWRF